MALSHVLRPDPKRSAKRLWSQEPSRRSQINTSRRASVSFMDVAASFSEEEWELLEEWQRDLYGDVMREIHNVLRDLGYHIQNSDILFRIVKDPEPESRVSGISKEGYRPDILLRINCLADDIKSSDVEEENFSAAEDTTDLLLRIKQEDQSCDSPVHQEETPSHSRDIKTELDPPQLSESDDGAHNTTAEEINTEWSPSKTSQELKPPSSGEAVQRDRVRRRKGIARQIKPITALHDSDQNKQMEPKENEAPRLPRLTNECESDYTGIKFPFPHSEVGEDAYPYQPYTKGLGEDAPISFQQRGQTFIICTVCGKTFCNNSSFQVHMRTHTGERPYKCTDCDKSFIRSSHLKIHLRTHTGERPYQCTECEKSFRDNSSFARHQRIHTGEKPYQCNTCGKYFRKKSNLKDHQRTHTGERPYKCKHCEKSFHQKSNLRVHERNHHVEVC